jgi:hypothetical protein
MYSYPPEYLLHPVPVLAIYGLSAADEAPLIDLDIPSSPIVEASSSPNASPSRNQIVPSSTTRSGLVNGLLALFTSKTEHNLYEASRYLSNPQAPPPFRVITVSKVPFNKLAFYITYR